MPVGPVAADRTRELRRAVLRPTLAPGAPLPGDDVPGAVHLGATDDDGTVVGTCFVFADPCPWLPGRPGCWHLRQMATAPDRRGRGIGSAVLAAAVELVRARGGSLVWCRARETAVGFYARHGFTAVGPGYLDAEPPVPHRDMYLELAAAPISS